MWPHPINSKTPVLFYELAFDLRWSKATTIHNLQYNMIYTENYWDIDYIYTVYNMHASNVSNRYKSNLTMAIHGPLKAEAPAAPAWKTELCHQRLPVVSRESGEQMAGNTCSESWDKWKAFQNHSSMSRVDALHDALLSHTLSGASKSCGSILESDGLPQTRWHNCPSHNCLSLQLQCSEPAAVVRQGDLLNRFEWLKFILRNSSITCGISMPRHPAPSPLGHFHVLPLSLSLSLLIAWTALSCPMT